MKASGRSRSELVRCWLRFWLALPCSPVAGT
ncbi:ribbon-helix-helix domain-containing protein [Mycobacteroides franklinii]